MEKFFIVTEESKLRKDYLDYIDNLKIVNEFVKNFMDKHSIKAKQYVATNEIFYIVPNIEDEEKFNKVLGKKLQDGLRPFKKSSKINKDWVNSLKENNFKVLRKPIIPFYFSNSYGKSRNRLFEENGVVYYSYENEYDFETPKGFTEIKGSEFYKVAEE